MFYSFYGSYTQISMIFESAQDLLHKFKHSAFLNKKGKRKTSWSRGRPAWLRPRPARALGPRGLRALPPLCAVTDERVPLVRPPLPASLSGTLTGMPHLSAPSSSRAAALPWLRPSLARFEPAPECASAPRQPCDSVATTRGRSTSLFPPRPREWRTAMAVTRRPATRAR